IDVDFEKFAVGDRGERLDGLARQVGHDPHHKGKLHLLLRPVHFDVVFDLYARRPVPGNELLAALLRHGPLLPRIVMRCESATASYNPAPRPHSTAPVKFQTARPRPTDSTPITTPRPADFP